MIELLSGFAAILGAFLFGYGKLSQKVHQLCNTCHSLETLLSNHISDVLREQARLRTDVELLRQEVRDLRSLIKEGRS